MSKLNGCNVKLPQVPRSQLDTYERRSRLKSEGRYQLSPLKKEKLIKNLAGSLIAQSQRTQNSVKDEISRKHE